MGRKTTTVWSCDGCDKAVDKKELRRFVLREETLQGRYVASGTTDICTGCEKTLHDTLRKLWPADEAAAFDGLVRP